ncbi:MAG: hypothetical protein AAF609_23335 [Cyanobacteria bacterium P01_C01_bin.120]
MHRVLIFSVTVVIGSTLILEQAVSQNSPAQTFERLSACRKLDAIARAGKSVPEYIAGSGYRQFDNEIRSTCTWHLESLNVALVSLGLDPTFEALTACEKLEAIEKAGKSVVDYLVGSGLGEFANDIGNNCPEYLLELDQALEEATGGPGPAAPFAVLPRCTQLDIIDSDPNKDVIEHIVGSGIEVYAEPVRNKCDRHLSALEEAERRVGIANSSDSESVGSAFEALAPCQKLDVIDDVGKSVPQYLAGSGLQEFSPDIYSNCRRHESALTEAQRLLNAAN